MERLSKITRCESPTGDQDEDINWEDFVLVKGTY